MKIINLLPQNERKEISLELVFGKMTSFWSTVVVSLLLFWALAFGVKLYLDQQITNVQMQIIETQKILNSSDYKDLQTEVLQLNATLKEVNNLRVQHYYWSRALTALSNLIPPGVQLNQLELDRGSGKIEISGQAVSRDDVIQLWANVIKSEHFKNINFPLANLERAKTADFSFVFYVNTDKLMDQ